MKSNNLEKLLYEKTQTPAVANCQHLLISTLQFCIAGLSSLIILYKLDNAVAVFVCNTCLATPHFKTKGFRHFKAVEHILPLWLFITSQIILSHISVAIEHLWMCFPYTHR